MVPRSPVDPTATPGGRGGHRALGYVAGAPADSPAGPSAVLAPAPAEPAPGSDARCGAAYPDRVRARAPASAANLGPGFDVLALALNLLRRGRGRAGLPADRPQRGRGGRASPTTPGTWRPGWPSTWPGHDRLAITVRSQIPVARGLGSSAALAVAAAAAAGSEDPLGVAARVDGHPENAAACVVGRAGGGDAWSRARCAPCGCRSTRALVFVVVVPERPLPTAKARQALPQQVSRDDATFNLGRMALLLAGLADRALLIREATEDRLHQDYRSPLFPEAPQLLARARRRRARWPSCWSGAGPTLLGICDGADGERVRAGAERPWREPGSPAGPGAAARPRGPGMVDGRPPARGPWHGGGRRPVDLLAGDSTSAEAWRPGRGRRSHRLDCRMARKFLIRTFGCQMNEHDSERLAGLLVADGLEPTDDVERGRRRRPQHVLHPGERRQQALRPPRAPEVAAGRAGPGLQIAVGGCLAQKDRELVRRAGRPRRRGLRHPQPGPAPRRCCAGRPPRARWSRSSTPRTPAPAPDHPPAPRPPCASSPYAAWVTIQTGCDNSCAFCIVPSVRGPEVSRPLDDLVAEVAGLAARGVVEVTLLGQNVNSYGRDLTRRRPLFAELLRAVGAVDGHPAGPLHEPAPEGPAARDDRGHGRDPRGVRAAPPATAVGERPGAAPPCAAGYTRRALPRAAWPPPAPPSTTWRSPPTSSWASPGETDDDFERTLEVVAEAAYDSAYTFIFSPRPGTRAAAMTDRFVPRRGRGRALRAAPGGGRALGPGPAPGPGRAGTEEVLVEGPEPARPAPCSPAAPARASSCTSPRRPPVAAPRAPSPRCAVTGAAPHHLTGAPGAVTGPAPAPHPDPGRRRLSRRRAATGDRRARWPWSAPTASGKSAAGPGRRAARPRRRRDRLGRLDVRLPGHGHRDGQAVAGGAGRGAPPPARPGRPGRGVHASAEFQRRGPTGPRRRSTARGTGPCSSAGPGSTCASVVDDLELPGRWPEVAAALEAEADGPAGLGDLYARLAALDPVAAGRIDADQPPPGRPGPRGDDRARAGPSRPSGPGLGAYPPTPFALVGIPFDPAAVDARDRGAVRAAGWPPASWTRSRALAARPGGPVPDGPPGPRLPRAAGPRRAGGAPRARAWTRRSGAPGPSPAASGPGSAATRGSAGSSPAEDPVRGARPGPRRRGRRPRRSAAAPGCETGAMGATEPLAAADQARGRGQRLPRAASTPTSRRPLPRAVVARPVRPAPGRRAPTGCIAGRARARRRRRPVDGAAQRRRRRWPR